MPDGWPGVAADGSKTRLTLWTAAVHVIPVFEAWRVRELLGQLIEDAVKAADASLWSLSDDGVVDALRAAHHCEQVLAVLAARLVRQAESRGLPESGGHRTTARWLTAHLLLDPQPARELSERATALAAHPALEQAMLDGTADARQATVIAAAVDAVPETLAGLDDPVAAPDIAREAEAALLARTREFPAYLLRRLGDRVLAHVAPDIADRADEIALQRQEARARRARTLTLSLPRDGQVRLSGVLGVEDAATVGAALEPLCRPLPADERTPGQRRADALAEVCRLALRTGRLPDHGGEPPQLTVTVPFAALGADGADDSPAGGASGLSGDSGDPSDGGRDPGAGRLGIGELDNGDRVSAATVRRLACDARVLPLVLGGDGQILDAGRSRRTATGALRRALAVRDRGCAFPGCDRPARWCDAHHLRAWSAGGTTDLDNLVLLCRHHHSVVHDPQAGWRVRRGRHHLPEFIPPPWSDPAQRPRRNAFHLRT